MWDLSYCVLWWRGQGIFLRSRGLSWDDQRQPNRWDISGSPFGSLHFIRGEKNLLTNFLQNERKRLKKKKKSTPRALCLSLIHLLESAKNIHHTHTHTFPKTTDLNLTRLSGSSQYFLISGYIQILNLETKEPVCAHETAYVIAQHFPHFTQLCFCSAVLAA